MYRNFLISIGAFLAFAAMLAFAFRLGPFASALLIELLIGIAATEVLVHNLPSAIRSGIADNCRRANGRWSHRRARIEDRAVRKLRWNILYALLLVAIPLNAILWYVNGEVIPVSIGWDAVASVRLDSPWKENLRDEEADFDHWSRVKGLTGALSVPLTVFSTWMMTDFSSNGQDRAAVTRCSFFRWMANPLNRVPIGPCERC